VARSAYYEWAQGKSHRHKGYRGQRATDKKVRESFEFHRGRYGTKRLADELGMSRERVRGSMRRQGLAALRPGRRMRTTDSKHNLPVFGNLLREMGNEARGAGEVFVGDITYLPLRGGKFCYLTCLQDKCTKRIAGWNVSANMKAAAAIDVVRQAHSGGWIKEGAIIHTDQGAQYASNGYRQLLSKNGFRQSMSRKGNCYDNAQAESLFSRIKTELMIDGFFETVDQARSEMRMYIDGYYNTIRRHSALGNRSPMKFEKYLKSKEQRLESVRHT